MRSQSVTPATLSMLECLRGDFLRARSDEYGTGVDYPGSVRLVLRFAMTPRLRALVWLRVAHELWSTPLRPLSLLLRNHVLRSCAAEVHPSARIGPGLRLLHTTGVVVGADVVLGARVTLHQGVTLGTGSRPGQPLVGDDVVIGAGAKVLGGVVVGHGAQIGANSVVLADVASATTVVGIPARPLPAPGPKKG